MADYFYLTSRKLSEKVAKKSAKAKSVLAVLTALLALYEKKGTFLHLIYSISSEGCTAAPSVGLGMRVEPAQW